MSTNVGEVVIVVLSNNQLVVGKLTAKELNGDITLDQPREFGITMDQRGQRAPAMAPYGSFGGLLPPMASASFRDHDVRHLLEAPIHVVDFHQRATSGIEVARGNVESLIARA